MASQSQLGSQATSARVHTEGESPPHQSHSGRQTERGQDGLRWGGTSPGCHRPRKPLKKRSGPSPRRAEASFPPHPPRQWEDPQRDPEGRSRPARGVPRAGRTARASIKPGTDDGGIRQRSHGIPGGGKPSHGCRTSRKD